MLYAFVEQEIENSEKENSLELEFENTISQCPELFFTSNENQKIHTTKPLIHENDKKLNQNRLLSLTWQIFNKFKQSDALKIPMFQQNLQNLSYALTPTHFFMGIAAIYRYHEPTAETAIKNYNELLIKENNLFSGVMCAHIASLACEVPSFWDTNNWNYIDNSYKEMDPEELDKTVITQKHVRAYVKNFLFEFLCVFVIRIDMYFARAVSFEQNNIRKRNGQNLWNN